MYLPIYLRVPLNLLRHNGGAKRSPYNKRRELEVPAAFMRSQLERFVAAARISKQATIKVEFYYISILYFRHSGKKLIKR